MFLREFIDTTKQQLSQYCVGNVAQLDYLLKTAKENKLDKNNKFEFNDLDNHVWAETDNVLCLSSQNSTIICNQVKDNHKIIWQIFAVDENKKSHTQDLKKVLKNLGDDDRIDYDIREFFVMDFKPINLSYFTSSLIDKGLSDNQIQKELKNFFDDKKSSKDYYVNDFNSNLYQIDHIFFQINNSTSVVSSEFSTQPQYPIDIYSHDYQLKSFCSNSKRTKMDFYEHVFMVLGNGYGWRQGNLIDSDAIYKKDIADKDIQSIKKGELTHIYPAFNTSYNPLLNYPSDITPEWKKAREEFILELKNLVDEFPTWKKSKQDTFLSVSDDKPYFTIEDLSTFISECEKHKSKKLKKG